ncbi:hypothetical protein ABC383_17750 [Noviherbaspirillum sp. 1P10PC]|uniref:hypothetical protein n=1 Tax=Noviherbaspirillum sp. 1P10PC TaxID=3132292 RepID=UPI0039A1D252
MDGIKKFRFTKQLIGMALRDGWTQKEIADVCRTQQSVVSSWKTGAAQAKESQLTKLLEIYGPRLRRKTFRVYYDLIKEPADGMRAHLIKVEGEVIFTFPFRNKDFCTQCQVESPACSCRSRERKMVATRKLIVHALGNGDFCCLLQARMLKDEYQMQFPETNIFITKVVGHFNSGDLLTYFDSMAWASDQEEASIRAAERIMLQMLSRKALLEHGYPVDGVEEHRRSW